MLRQSPALNNLYPLEVVVKYLFALLGHRWLISSHTAFMFTCTGSQEGKVQCISHCNSLKYYINTHNRGMFFVTTKKQTGDESCCQMNKC